MYCSSSTLEACDARFSIILHHFLGIENNENGRTEPSLALILLFQVFHNSTANKSYHSKYSAVDGLMLAFLSSFPDICELHSERDSLRMMAQSQIVRHILLSKNCLFNTNIYLCPPKCRQRIQKILNVLFMTRLCWKCRAILRKEFSPLKTTFSCWVVQPLHERLL